VASDNVAPMGSVLAERVAALRSDRSHGGSWMARQAVEALAEAADVPAESTEELLERLDAAGRELAASRPAMGGIAGAVGRVLAAAHHSTHLPPDELRRLVDIEVSGLVGSRDRAAASIAIQLSEALTGARVLTHSASATVREAVVHTPPELVMCTVSAPFEEGRAFAEDLGGAGLPVELVEDADAEGALERASLLLIGADTVFRDGAVANKVGTRALAEEAKRRGVRTVVACEVIKLAPIDAPAQIADEHFDVTPAEFVDEIVTEEGAYASDDVASLVNRTPFLAEGYALLRGA
jgi:translation initiation factor 2B subunit (eIF-2B alpha/beta/delta family)